MKLTKARGTITIVYDADNPAEAFNIRKAMAYEAETKIDNIFTEEILSVHDIPDGWGEVIIQLPDGMEATIFDLVNDKQELNELNSLSPEVLEVIRSEVRSELRQALKPIEDFKEAL